jgi:hypothetical protein
MSENILMNEEDIRGKLLLPFLESLGFNSSEISLEKSFSIRLGKTEKIIRGRSDILCTRNGKNLFIIELKKDSVSITKDDINQGISYARLLEGNIAPFAIITNGVSTKIFDTLTREELTGSKISKQSAFWKNGCKLSTDEDMLIRYEALKNFISFSSENLKYFCKKQVRDRMGPIVGNIDNSSAKYIKELYVTRHDLQSAFANFTSSNFSAFAIVGDAGAGKTNAMCSLALHHLENNFVFFYNATILKSSPLEYIAQDLNGVFSSRIYSNVLLKKLNDLGSFLKKKVIIFIDAIDESVNSNINIELSEIALGIRHLKNIKICVSCKSNIWAHFLKVRDTNTHLFEELNKTHNKINSLENCPGFLLESFNDEELKDIIPLYKNAFGFKGEISITLFHELRNGFFLRIFSEVYSNKQIPEKITDKELIAKYIKQSLAKTDLDTRSAMGLLSNIGKALINYQFNSLQQHNEEGLEAEMLYNHLNLSFYESLPEELFTRNLLLKSNKDDSYNISFYFSKIRDYIICFHSYKLDTLDDTDFYNILPKFYINYVGQSAIAFYIENASFEHRNIIIKFKKDKALQYAVGYNSYLDENFRPFKHFFDPHTSNEIGIILPKDLIKSDGYALYPIEQNASNKLLLENLETGNSDNYRENVFYKFRVYCVYSSNNALLQDNQNKIIQKNIFKELSKIVEKGKMTAYNSDFLNKEIISNILYFYGDKLDYNFNLKDFNLPRFESIYPIDLPALKEKVYNFRARYYYQNEKADLDSIDSLVEKALKDEFEIPKLNAYGNFPPFEELFKIVNILLDKGYSQLSNHHLPCPDRPITEARDFYNLNVKENRYYTRILQFSEKQAKLYIMAFFESLETCYKEFVDYCFPSFKEDFKFYNMIPHEYFFYMKDADIRKWGSFGYRQSTSGKLNLYFMEHENMHEKFEKDGITSLRSFSLDYILHMAEDFRHFPKKTVDRITTERVDEFCVIRNWVYKILEDDMEYLFKKIDD